MGKKNVSGKLFTSHNHLENVLKCNLLSPFRQKLLNGIEFLEAACMFSKVLIWSLNLNTNPVFIQWKSRELLSFESVPPSSPKYGFQLCADGGA